MDERRKLGTNSLSAFRSQSRSHSFITLFKTVHRTQLSHYYIMRFLYMLIVTLLAVNLMVDLLDNDMKSIIDERNETIQKLRNK